MTEKKRWKFEVRDLKLQDVSDTGVRISNETGARRFFQYLFDPLGLIWHPDTAFEDYVDLETGERIFSPRACDLLDGAMAECFEVLGNEVVYEIALEELHKWEADVRRVLAARGIAYKPCGLNADWCVDAWHLSPGEPNMKSGDFYLLDEEEDDPEERARYRVVSRVYTHDDLDGDGNDDVTTITGPGLLEPVLDEWISKQKGVTTGGNSHEDGGQPRVRADEAVQMDRGRERLLREGHPDRCDARHGRRRRAVLRRGRRGLPGARDAAVLSGFGRLLRQ